MASNKVSQNKYYEGYEEDIKEFTKRVEKTVLDYLNKTSTKFDALADDAFPVLYSKYCHAILFKSLGEKNLKDFYDDLKIKLNLMEREVVLKKELHSSKREVVLCELVDELKLKIRKNVSMDEEFFTVCGRIVVICDYLKKDKKSFKGESFAEIYKRAEEAFRKDILRKDYDKNRKEALAWVRNVMKWFDEHHSYCQDSVYNNPLRWMEETIPTEFEETIKALSEKNKQHSFIIFKNKCTEKFYEFLKSSFADFETAVNTKEDPVDDIIKAYMELSFLAIEYRNYNCREGFEAALDYLTKVMAIAKQTKYFD